jgi:hypothetical protein
MESLPLVARKLLLIEFYTLPVFLVGAFILYDYIIDVFMVVSLFELPLLAKASG